LCLVSEGARALWSTSVDGIACERLGAAVPSCGLAAVWVTRRPAPAVRLHDLVLDADLNVVDGAGVLLAAGPDRVLDAGVALPPGDAVVWGYTPGHGDRYMGIIDFDALRSVLVFAPRAVTLGYGDGRPDFPDGAAEGSAEPLHIALAVGLLAFVLVGLFRSSRAA
jgi:hypothetical protein